MFTSTPHKFAPVAQWQVHLANLLLEDQRKPFIAMAVRRARQQIEFLTELENRGKTNEDF